MTDRPEPHAPHTPGSDPDGDEFVVGYNVYRRFWCHVPGCTVSTPQFIREIDDDD